MAAPLQRLIVYIDGFNLYYGLRSKGWKRYYWLDLYQLACHLVKRGQLLRTVRYFTARVVPEANDPNRHLRQDTYLQALATLPDLSIQYGHFLPKQQRCPSCGANWTTYEEKMTDVNIATKLIEDAHDDAFDIAIVVSGDGDLAGPITAVRERFNEKQVIVAFPPDRVSKNLRKVATAYFTIGRIPFRDSQLPEQFTNAHGHILIRPETWS